MYKNEDVISKVIATPDGEKNFQVRYIRDENVGIICTPTDKSYFLLDSADYWYDLIQEKYPPIMKCSCKNDRFNLTLDYTPMVDTEDFREISINCFCTVCQKSKRLPPIKIDYSPSSQLFDHPITFCKKPKIKYKTYSLAGYWSDDELVGMAEYLLGKGLFVYCWYWDSQNAKRHFKELSATELYAFLTGNEQGSLSITELHTFLSRNKTRYLAIYFSEEPLDNIPMRITSDGRGIYIQDDIWRKNRIIMLHRPFWVMSRGMFYRMDFCSEYLDKDGNIVPKSASFCALVKDFQKFSKKLLKK
jgi:hypothetical protein